MPHSAGVVPPRWIGGALTARRVMRGALLWGLLFGFINIGSVSGYATAYATPDARGRLAASFQGNVGLSALDTRNWP